MVESRSNEFYYNGYKTGKYTKPACLKDKRPNLFPRTTDPGGVPSSESAPVGGDARKILVEVPTRRLYKRAYRIRTRVNADYVVLHRPQRRAGSESKRSRAKIDPSVLEYASGKTTRTQMPMYVSIPVSVLQEVFPEHDFYKEGITVYGNTVLHLPSNSVVLIFDAKSKFRVFVRTQPSVIVSDDKKTFTETFKVELREVVTARPARDVFVYDYLPVPEAHSLIIRWPCELIDPVSGVPRLTAERMNCWPEEYAEVARRFENRKFRPDRKGPMFEWGREIGDPDFLDPHIAKRDKPSYGDAYNR